MNYIEEIEGIEPLSSAELETNGGLLIVIAFAIGFWVGYRETHGH
jgi:hypothetical protein